MQSGGLNNVVLQYLKEIKKYVKQMTEFSFVFTFFVAVFR